MRKEDRKKGNGSILTLSLVLTSVVFAGLYPFAQSNGDASPKASPSHASLQQLTEPEGAQRCQPCHSAEVEGFAQSAMAHALRKAGQEPDGVVITKDSRITIHSSSAGYWQRLENEGEVTGYRIDYVIGSGKHASGYLVDLANHLFQSPVAYYKSRHAYDLAPGYENLPNPDFTRPVGDGCLFCHSGSALKVQGTANEYRTPPFSAEAITCERCHGSAERHLEDTRAGTIINPAKLEKDARDSICEQCHLLGVGRVLNPGRRFSDFRPGERMEDVFTTYRNVLPPGAEGEKFKVISHVEQLAKSVCSQRSDGKLWCGTCHDPHNQPADPVSFFRSKCLSCHTKKLPSAHPDEQSNCIACHMPRRDAKDGGHTAFTDHRIQRRPAVQESTAAELDIAAWREPVPELQKRNLGIAYVNVGMQQGSRSFIGRGYRMLTEVQTQFANDSELFTALGSALLVAKQASEAELAFGRALQLDPGSVTGETNVASAYLQAGDPTRAITHLERAIALDPFHLPALVPLIEIHKQKGETAKAAALSARLSSAMESHSENNSAKDIDPARTLSAESVYKNVHVLNKIPSEQLVPAMRFIAASLGVECSYCHVPNHFEKDDKKAKQTARDMIRMVLAIDSASFAGTSEVTCYSCHRGSTKPQSTPALAGEKKSAELATELNLLADLPTADQIVDSYIRALGGEQAIDGITSRREVGTVAVNGRSSPVEILGQAPDKEALVRHTPTGDSSVILDEQEGWSSVPGRPLHEMHGAELEAARIDADLHLPLNIKNVCAELRVEYPAKVADRNVFEISCVNAGKPPVQLYFDEQSGVLVRMVRYQPTPLGNLVTQIDYSDYREVGGIKTPFRWSVADANEITTTQLDEVEWNVPIDAIRFRRPREKMAQ